MLILKAWHIIFMVAWFAGLFYLPRLFVYHAETDDKKSIERFCLMERRLYYGIMWPASLLTTLFGIGLIMYNPTYYLGSGWMHVKILLVVLLWAYQLYCGHCIRYFARGKNTQTSRFYRFFNELPTVLLMGIVLLVVIKPSLSLR